MKAKQAEYKKQWMARPEVKAKLAEYNKQYNKQLVSGVVVMRRSSTVEDVDACQGDCGFCGSLG